MGQRIPSETAADQLVRILNDGCLGLMLSLGHRTGLFDALGESPTTIEALSHRASLQQRYVREWLGAMVTGAIVCHEPSSGTYWLDAEHAALLTDGGDANLAAFAQYLAVLGGVEDELVHCFREGGGVPYARYPRFHEVMAADSGQTVLAALRPLIVPLVPGLEDRLAAGVDVLDVGCGRGQALQQLARDYPRSRFCGIDLSADAIASASAAAHDLSNLTFVVLDAMQMESRWPTASFDLITTFDAVHDQAHPAQVVASIRRLLRDGGVYLAQDINTSGSHHGDRDHPLGPFIYTISTMHCMTVSLAQGGEGLGAAWGRPAAEALFRDAGFTSVVVHVLPHDDQNAYYVCQP